PPASRPPNTGSSTGEERYQTLEHGGRETRPPSPPALRAGSESRPYASAGYPRSGPGVNPGPTRVPVTRVAGPLRGDEHLRDGRAQHVDVDRLPQREVGAEITRDAKRVHAGDAPARGDDDDARGGELAAQDAQRVE